ncbi:unnamed protein product [Prorocentrum cordatum]|uniref:Uncharacterized protein n=1 Tax=Prorocentrum cordatum TaxID=2364126 RepID=A0ABN9TGI9_9DINO|nr:unnamed protein product [Polarella glacialis]
MHSSNMYNCAAPCRAMRILMALAGSILPSIPFATGVSRDHQTFPSLSTWRHLFARKHAVATPSPTTCVDSAGGATNRFGKGCEAYSHDYENPFSGICFDPYYDDSDFTSGSMCCVCPEECPDLPRIRLEDNCEDWVSFSDANTDGENPGRSHHSNLGGLGPQFHMPNELRYYGIGRTADGSPLDVTFTNTSLYVPRNTDWNSIFGAMATVNLLTGESVTLKGEFVRNHSFCPEFPVRPKITFCDVDHFKDGENEVVLLDGISAVYTVDGDIDFDMELYEYDTITSNNPALLAYNTTSVQTPIPGRSSRMYVANSGGKFGIKVTSSMFGHGCDNPADPNNLTNITCPTASSVTVDQAKRCFMVEFANTSEFVVGFKILTDAPPFYTQQWGRNFAMSGTSNYFVDEASHPQGHRRLPRLLHRQVHPQLHQHRHRQLHRQRHRLLPRRLHPQLHRQRHRQLHQQRHRLLPRRLHRQVHPQMHRRRHRQLHRQHHRLLHRQRHRLLTRRLHRQVHPQLHRPRHRLLPRRLHRQVHPQVHRQGHRHLHRQRHRLLPPRRHRQVHPQLHRRRHRQLHRQHHLLLPRRLPQPLHRQKCG